MINVYLDIETIPSQESWVRDYVASTVTHPGQMKKPETIAKWAEEEKPSAVEDALGKCSFDGALNHIVCIGMAIDNAPVETFVGDEIVVISSLYGALSDVGFHSRFIGHNISGFDLRVIRQRSVILGIKPPACVPFDAKPWDTSRVYDTMIQWDSQNKARLDKIARAMGMAGKSGDGSMVYQMWKDGKYAELAQYCASDVELVRNVYRRMTYGN